MEILQVPKARKLAAAYNDGHLTLTEFMDELELCWDMKIHQGTKALIVERNGVPMPPITTQGRQPKRI